MAVKTKTMDGNSAAAHAAYAFTEVAAIYPITPSSPMAEYVDEWSANGQENIFGRTVNVTEMQSEGGAAGALHGSLTAGALTTTFTASQGLLLMIPNMYKIAGEMLPAVFHVSARALAGHALSIFGDHSDVMATRQTGFAMLCSNSVQEVMDLAGIAHLSAIRSSIPFLHFFDGFRTSHEIQKVEVMDYDVYKKLVDWDAVKRFRDRALSPESPYTKGTAQNPDIFFQSKEAANRFYEELPDTVNYYMEEISKVTGREYKPFNYYGCVDAEEVVIAMGSVCDALEEVVDYLNAQGHKTGLVKVHLYRPFSEKYFRAVLPKTVKKIAVLDRTKEPGSVGQPLYLDVKSLLYKDAEHPTVVGGIYGLGSKDTTPTMLKTVFDNLFTDCPKDDFTVGIVDDVTFKSLEIREKINTVPKGTISCMFWGLGSDGTVGANKSAIKIIGDNTDMYAQGYFSYDSKKSGGVTISHLRFGTSPITSTYLIDSADFVSCSAPTYVKQYDMVRALREGATFLLNTTWSENELNDNLPASMKRALYEKKAQFYIINATQVAKDVGLGRKINMVMQSAFFYLSKVIDYEMAEDLLKKEVVKSYGKKGENIVKMNYAAIENAVSSLRKVEIPESWKDAADEPSEKAKDVPEFVEKLLIPMNAQAGDDLPVSAFTEYANGVFPAGTSQYEKRCIADDVPEWQPDKCIQCNRCSFVCPHAAIRPVLVTEEEAAAAPEGFVTLEPAGKGFDGLRFRIQVSPMDCTGCGSCANVCPAKESALVMKPLDTELVQAGNWDYMVSLKNKQPEGNNIYSVKGSQFVKPLLEFSGACAGCGETPYAKLVTQLFGDRMYIANATGCSSIWGASAPSTPYTVNDEGKGPAWANSLFEDNAEYGLGMALAVKALRETIKAKLEKLASVEGGDTAQACTDWIASMNDAEGSQKATEKLLSVLENASLEGEAAEIRNYITENRKQLTKKSFWIFGGDGWSYDIGYGGLDHVLASGEDVNVLVFDTEVYSNTGGQSSKSTPTAAVAKFAAQGKKVKKKDLGAMAMAYGYVYVAQVAMGADYNQLLKALKEAESYHGPSLIICYAPCINHGIKAGMNKAMDQMKNAVDSGYWHLYRYNPLLADKGENPFTLDSKEPTASFRDFILSENRYTALQVTFPDIADELFERTEEDARARYEKYRALGEK